MKLVVVSDTHGKHRQLNLPKGDVLIHCGDATESFVGFLDFCRWLDEADFKHTIVIAGNHDRHIFNNNDICRNHFKEIDVNYLENSGCFVDDIMFWGSPYTPTFNDWWFMADRGKSIQRFWNMMPTADVIITHGPPYGILDNTFHANGDIAESVGCSDLLLKIHQVRPKYHLFGHLHGCYGKKKLGGTTFVNASSADEMYSIVNKPWVLEI